MLIETRDLRKIYQVGDTVVVALDGVNVAVEKGEFLGVMGPSGSGKSTFMNVVGCLDQPTSGQYLFEGRDVSRLDPDTLAEIRNRKIGFVFQGFNLLPRATAQENVALPLLYSRVPAKERAERAMAALKAVGLEGREHHRPTQLSGGQQQRVAIARALVNDAAIIFADEPTGNLDTRASREIMELFVRLNEEKGITVIVVTHDPDTASFSKRIIRFLDGRIVADDRNGGQGA
ncbi:MAG TPA: ABC transporter ATP-binding protein [Syntrophales bacterium]|nr:ABC transporter ATP-binding protein [Syntrophales bacterium]HOM07769.1 ABC transporter ATP-binding protein [Syntrophales bacterium]HON99462.1 ABC transporter ATP-binding protein [Syntrophales bacterium]HPC00803.1 ABC transporter ATP-binding protein [Syntrophales bacterium]HPQ05999.1 ABC transporter ATP-binding protein [Syntrophales bacterium]